MLESIIAFVKSFPAWLATVVEVLIVAVIFSAAVIFLWGVVTGIRIIRGAGRRNKIEEISVFPPKIKFKTDDQDNKEIKD